MIRSHVLHVPGVDPARDLIVAELSHQSDTCVHLDPKRKGLMRNWLGALRCAMDDSGDWALILSDDALPLPGWWEHLPRAQANSPSPLLGLTHFGGYGSSALAKGAAYGVGRLLIWGGAMTIRGDHLEPLARSAMRFHYQTGYPHDDGAVALYGHWKKVGTAMTSRALFDQPVESSLLGHNTKVRRPSSTIINCAGPDYSPDSFVAVSRGDRRKFDARYAAYLAAQEEANDG